MLSSEWVGETMFFFTKREVPPGYTYYQGRPTQRQTTSRADNVWPHIGDVTSRKQRQKATAEWKVLKAEYRRSVDLS